MTPPTAVNYTDILVGKGISFQRDSKRLNPFSCMNSLTEFPDNACPLSAGLVTVLCAKNWTAALIDSPEWPTNKQRGLLDLCTSLQQVKIQISGATVGTACLSSFQLPKETLATPKQLSLGINELTSARDHQQLLKSAAGGRWRGGLGGHFCSHCQFLGEPHDHSPVLMWVDGTQKGGSLWKNCK